MNFTTFHKQMLLEEGMILSKPNAGPRDNKVKKCDLHPRKASKHCRKCRAYMDAQDTHEMETKQKRDLQDEKQVRAID